MTSSTPAGEGNIAHILEINQTKEQLLELRQRKTTGPAVAADGGDLGLAFVAQKTGAHVGAFTFNGSAS